MHAFCAQPSDDDAPHKFFLTAFDFSVEFALCSAICAVALRGNASDTEADGFS
jgi:hypothetical protein